ncbi:hypothetical protein ACA910_006786 [Epithemia clementina (nom. ined.)]
MSSKNGAALVSTAAAAVVAGISCYYYYYSNSRAPTNSTKGRQEQSANREPQQLEKHSNARSSPPMKEVRYKDDTTSASNNNNHNSTNSFRILSRNSITIVHGSVTGTCRQMAKDLYQRCRQQFPHRRVQLASIPELDWWDELINDDSEDDDDDMNDKTALTPLLLVLLPTHTDGAWTPPSIPLQSGLQELATDWRIAQFPLKGKLQVGLFGVGSSAYDVSTMGQPAREAVRQFQTLGAKCVVRLQVGDVAVGTHAWDTYHDWLSQLVQQVHKFDNKVLKRRGGGIRGVPPPIVEAPAAVASTKTNGACGCQSSDSGNTNGAQPNGHGNGEGCCQTKSENHEESNKDNDGDCDDAPDEYDDEYDDDDDQEQGEPEVMDMEDMGGALVSSSSNKKNNQNEEPPEMVTPSQAAALKKEGYKLIGTHSAVKLCRWTKHQLRGRGGCYKHTFYGITSYQCMEATPSLACANKCVFCWRHHKNPVGKEWRWKTDDPEFIVDQAVQTHIGMIQEAKGIPGVRMDRWREAHTVRHCALSLVGEPIMYPRIHELLGALHQRKISTFLVTNGQHPAAIETLRPITQLYVSVDAPTKASLIEIDRPLFKDAWERLRQSLQFLKDKGQRTVARLTVVKGWNSNELQGYAELIALGHVSLVEVKGVTFCGKSDASNLNMSNTPWHHEVVSLTQQLQKELQIVREKQLKDKAQKRKTVNGVMDDDDQDILPEYGLACEHQHSCSVLLARVDQFADKDPVTGKIIQWNTWIDYEKFHALVQRQAMANHHQEEDDPKPMAFSVQDYTAPTPAWALFGAQEHGFDPTETRHRKKHKYPKYTQFDARGVPTHDHNDQPIDEAERARLTQLMEEKLQALGEGVQSVTTELADGAKYIEDPSNMFRGMVVTKE